MKGEMGSPGLEGPRGASGLKGQKGEPGMKGKASVCDLWVPRRGPVVRGLGVFRTRGVEVYWLPDEFRAEIDLSLEHTEVSKAQPGHSEG